MDLKFEGVDLEYKKAKNNLPESFWETYSAFANTNGGKIILGIDEKNIDPYQGVNRLPANGCFWYPRKQLYPSEPMG
ncbi:mobile genetic element [Streptococcus pneumoniae]|nr:mobile genetic element [Streptococcus pneumoniae]